MTLFFVLTVLIVGWLLYKQYAAKLLNQGKAGKIKLALIIIGIIFLLLAVTGRAHAVFALIGALLTQVMRFWPLLVRFVPQFIQRNSNTQPHSSLHSQTLTLTLVHSSGSMTGLIHHGNHKGQSIESLSDKELEAFQHYCQEHDPKAAQLVRVFVNNDYSAFEDEEQKKYGNSSQNHSSGRRSAQSSTMSQEEALAVLGLNGKYTRNDVIDAHRKLMSKLHPDKGGNDYLAQKLNSARDCLLKTVNKA